MKHLFIPYKLSLLAKEKGFDEPCFGFYDTQRDEFWLMESYPYLYDKSRKPLAFKQVLNCDVTAPLYQQLIDWFREKHNIHIKIDDFINNDKGEWDYEVVKVGTGIDEKGNYVPLIPYSSEDTERENLSYYETLNKAIEEAFKLI
jgi:hypothetical protein